MDAPSDEERLKAFAPIQEMITFVQFANDECDYGMGYELGMDLFCFGSHVSTRMVLVLGIYILNHTVNFICLSTRA